MKNAMRISAAGAVLGSAMALFLVGGTALAVADPARWADEWPNTDFSRHTVDFAEILSGGPPRDGIPSIDKPAFVAVSKAADTADTEPVIGLIINGDARAYPLRVLIWHEIVNDVVGGVPVLVTYCPLCNAAIVFERTVDGRVLEFGTTGKLRHSDLVMYDRQTDSWWQQFVGEGIVGEMTGKVLTMVASRQESLARFRARAPDGKILVPNDKGMRQYGTNPYVYYDTASAPFLYRGAMPKGIKPMARVVAVGSQAWSLALLRDKGSIISGDLTLKWEAGQNSALDSRSIAQGRDVGNVTVQKNGQDVVHDVTFAFVFHAFRPEGVIHALAAPGEVKP